MGSACADRVSAQNLGDNMSPLFSSDSGTMETQVSGQAGIGAGRQTRRGEMTEGSYLLGVKMTMKQAQAVYDHLMRTGQAFCFVDGVIVSREACQAVLFGKNLAKEVDKQQAA